MVVVGHVEHGLSPALLRNLAAEIPSIDFTLADGAAVDSIWICGYEPRHAGLLEQLRARHPEAAIVVTRGGPLQAWAGEARRAGADVVSSWPLEFEELGQLLRVRGRARLEDR